MAMQRTPLLMSKILDRGAQVAPNEEIVTATESGRADKRISKRVTERINLHTL